MDTRMTNGYSTFKDPEIREHLLHSRFVQQQFTIRVLQPIRRNDDSERFPVIYAPDSDELFDGISALSSVMHTLGDVPRFILVGIGYGNVRKAEILRMRDLFTPAIRAYYHPIIEELARSPLVGGVDNLEAITTTTSAREFLQFIRDELMQFIADRYPVVRGDNSYFGYSAGGTFGLYTLFTQPETFGRYLLGSPATSYDGHHFGIDLARRFLQSGKAMNAKVFLSVGELEEFKRGCEQLDLVSGYYLLAKFLKKAAIPGLDLTVRLFLGETHATAWTPAFSHGWRTLFGPVEQVPYWPDYLK
jgi:predicted alpha/beta superfamily hydrolase